MCVIKSDFSIFCILAENVLDVSDIAEKYQCTLIINRCKAEMSNSLKSEIELAAETGSDACRYDCARECLEILIKADSLHYQDQLSEAVNTISRFNYKYFAGKVVNNQKGNKIRMFGSCTPASNQSERNVEDAASECKDLYESLTEEMQYKLLMQRLTVCDNVI